MLSNFRMSYLESVALALIFLWPFLVLMYAVIWTRNDWDRGDK
ncbi:hypothetical protein BMS3Bbin01_02239 [bacterium BMS3Bbin01]|nr:hypothetical protein BMS3Bbin01_02239 [bacterium BMS3Bbin01]